MKIEKVNENQIRCTLTREDLASRELKISELAYGTEKAKNLFRDMMQQANFEFGFEAEDIPLMIEAIPLNAECIVLIITKVEDPEELDTRFSRFAPHVTQDEDEEEDEEYADEETREAYDLFRRLQDTSPAIKTEPAPSETASSEDASQEKLRSRIFVMDSLGCVMDAAKICGRQFLGQSTLYKDERMDKYLLVLVQGDASREDFDRIGNTLSEYGSLLRTNSGKSFLEEHCEALIPNNALQILSS